MFYPRNLLYARLFHHSILPQRGKSVLCTHIILPSLRHSRPFQTVRNPVSLRKLLRLSPKEAAVESEASTVVNAPLADDKSGPVPFKKLLVPRVIIPAANYAFLAIVDINLRAIQPVFYSTPIALGGLGLAPQQIGWILSVYGIVNGLTQILLFSRINDRFGSKRVYLVGVASVLPVFAMFPFINEVARLEGRMVPLVWGLVFGQALLSIIISFSYGPSFPSLCRCV